MPGIRYAYSTTTQDPTLRAGFMGVSQTIRAGDALVQTTKSTIVVTAGISIIRPLLAADKTAHYKEGTPVAGIMGVAKYSATSNATGVITGGQNPGGGGMTLQWQSMGQENGLDPNNNQSPITLYAAVPYNVFVCALSAASAAATSALNQTLAGLLLTGTNPTTYAIDTTAAAADQCIRIIECDQSDPLYGAVGGRVFFQFMETFSQPITAVNYSTN